MLPDPALFRLLPQDSQVRVQAQRGLDDLERLVDTADQLARQIAGMFTQLDWEQFDMSDFYPMRGLFYSLDLVRLRYQQLGEEVRDHAVEALNRSVAAGPFRVRHQRDPEFDLSSAHTKFILWYGDNSQEPFTHVETQTDSTLTSTHTQTTEVGTDTNHNPPSQLAAPVSVSVSPTCSVSDVSDVSMFDVSSVAAAEPAASSDVSSVSVSVSSLSAPVDPAPVASVSASESSSVSLSASVSSVSSVSHSPASCLSSSSSSSSCSPPTPHDDASTDRHRRRRTHTHTRTQPYTCRRRRRPYDPPPNPPAAWTADVSEVDGRYNFRRHRTTPARFGYGPDFQAVW